MSEIRKVSLGSGSQIAAIQLPIAYTPEQAAAATGRSRSRIYKAVKDKELTARKDGRATIFEDNELRRWIRTFPTVGRETVSA
jgi:excisionase family DNA binding protein